MKKLLLVALLALAGSTAFAQAPSSKIKDVLTAKTWKVEFCTINGITPDDFAKTNNIKADLYRKGDRYIFRNDGTFSAVSTAGQSSNGIWTLGEGNIILDPGRSDGGLKINIPMVDPNGWQGRIIRRLGMCSVTSLYEVIWTPATM